MLLGVIMKKLNVFFILLVASFLSLENASAGFFSSSETDAPKKPIPAICKADNKVFVGNEYRTRTLQFRAAPSERIELCSNVSCQLQFITENTCADAGIVKNTSLDIDINELCLRPGNVCEEASTWIGDKTAVYPTCAPVVQQLEVRVFAKLNAEELKRERCSKIDECLSELDSKSDIKLAKQ